MDRFVVISGCSGGGKSSLLQELQHRGFATVEEPGRRIVKEEIDRGGTALPWMDALAFIRRAIEMSLADIETAAQADGWVFFDRGLIDAAAGLYRLAGDHSMASIPLPGRYNRQVFLTPPWPEIFVTDQERRHSIEDAIPEYLHLLDVYPSLGYTPVVVPKTSVSERADFVLCSLSIQSSV